MRREIWVGRYIGIDVYLHYSWFLIFALLAYALATNLFPSQFPDQSAGAYWILGTIASALLFVSVLLHELSHSYIARRHGMKVDRITLFFFGGMASASEQHITPKKEFQMAIAGPAMSLAISGTFLVIYNLTGFFYIAAIAGYLYRINLILAVFNLVPGFPLDGGRVLRSIIWYWTKDFEKATRIASTGGKIVAYVLFGLGIFSLFSGNFSGVWLMLIALFILTLSTLSYEQVLLKDMLKGMTAGDFADSKFMHIGPKMKIKDAVVKHFLKKDIDNILVTENSSLKGLLTIKAVQQLKKESWPDKSVEEIMIPAGKVAKTKIHTPAYTALIKMLKKGQDIAPIIDKKKVVAVIRRESMLRFVKLKSAEKHAKEAGLVEMK